ncbi:MAG: hypothetical protein LBT89_06105 [Planctomycetaceae bacterium]|jgi:hypothetical protein|nr:hypothetical protein [Planctomycetaceae bacterium]
MRFLLAVLLSVVGLSICFADADPLDLPPIVFTERHQYRPDHHNTATFFPSAANEYNDGKFTPGGRLMLRHPDGKVETLLETKTGVFRDPDVHWNAEKIVFSYRKEVNDSYHIYEMDITAQPPSAHIKQLTFAEDADDIFPFYLADDHIGFSSTREPKYCGCNRHIMANLYRMEPDGANIYQISKNTLFDSRGRMLPDGRILYDRWEYVDRNFGDGQALWTCHPDGTNHAVYYGNNTASPGAVIDARPIPGSDKIVCLFSSCHDRPWGALAFIDRKLGIDGEKPVWRVYPDVRKHIAGDDRPHYLIDTMKNVVKQKIANPFPLNECEPKSGKVLYSMQINPSNEKTGIYVGVMDVSGTLIYEDKEYGCYEPVPLVPRKRPPVLPFKRDFTSKTGTFYVHNVYNGTGMQNVKRGEVKYLRVVESLAKKYWAKRSWLSTSSTVTWDEFMNKRVLGIVPVNEDGSVTVSVPAETFLYFQLLDKDGVMIQSMRSGTFVQPGEVQACAGCHEDRLEAVKVMNTSKQQQKNNAAVTLDNNAEGYSYLENVQPVWDKYCVSCHNAAQPAGQKLNLTGYIGQAFNVSYAELWAKHYIRAVGGGPAKLLPAKSWGARTSKIYPYLMNPPPADADGVKCGALNLKETDPAAFRKVCEWIDLNAPYYPDAATSYWDNPYGRSPLSIAETQQLEKLTGQKIFIPSNVRSEPFYFYESETLHPRDAALLKLVTILNFDTPEKSPVIEGLASSVRKEALEIIQCGSERIKLNGKNDLNGFRYCEIDAWRAEKYQQRGNREKEFRKAIVEGRKLYDKR